MADIIPFGEWKPDLTDFHSSEGPFAIEAQGVFPRDVDSYGPVGSFSALSTTPLSARCQGAIGTRDKSGVVRMFAGDATKLYLLSSLAWGDVSRLAGGAYACAADEGWRFVQVGDRLVALQLADYPQLFTLSSSTNFAALSASAYLPKARYGAQVADWLMLGNLNDTSGGGLGVAPSRVWWGGKGDVTSWPQPATAAAAAAQSGYSAELEGGWVQGIVGAVGGASGAIFTDDSVHRVQVIGPPAVFDIVRVEGARGCVAPNSIFNYGKGVVYLAEDGWYVFDGTQSLPIGSRRIDNWFYDQFSLSDKHRISVAADPERKLVIISFPGAGAISSTPNRLLIWNWEINRWSWAEATVELIVRLRSSGYTLEQLDSFGTMDTLPFSLDSRAWTGGLALLGAFNTSHNSGALDGSNQAAILVTQEFDGTGGRKKLYCDGFRPIVDGGTITGSLLYRDTQDGTQNVATASSPGVDGVCRQRSEGRYMAARVNIAAAGSWSSAKGVQPANLKETAGR